MGVDIDGLDPLAGNHDGKLMAGWLLGVGALQQTATAEDDAGRGCGGPCLEKITASGHDSNSSLCATLVCAYQDVLFLFEIPPQPADGQIQRERMPFQRPAARQPRARGRSRDRSLQEVKASRGAPHSRHHQALGPVLCLANAQTLMRG
jgi:hypothetical protein